MTTVEGYPKDLDAFVIVKEIAPGVTTLACPFSRVIVEIGARATHIKAQFADGPGMIMVSPIPVCDVAVATLEGLPLKYIVAPDMVHYMAIPGWKEKYPDAKIIGCKSLTSQKLTSLGLACDFEVTDFDCVIPAKELGLNDVKEEEELKFIIVGAHMNRELVTFHGQSKVMVVGDLIFNLPPTEQYSKSKLGLLDRFLYATGIGRYAQSKIPDLLIKNKETGKTALKVIEALDFDTVVMCHGDSVIGTGKEFYTSFFSSLL
ncbi:hypothetical protein BZA70DRAFT_281474 [Myxozyma melibiosi]|uniref:Uncharacterized protein n=1 Tax=Myxozyma melibiosi TaxID=54550 RepID=A0ABR1F4N9_9ASCO